MKNILPRAMFSLSLAILFFAYGVVSTAFEVFPHRILHSAYVTAKTFLRVVGEKNRAHFIAFTDDSIDTIPDKRISTKQVVSHPERFLVSGGRYQFLEHCPEFGCIAIEISRDGQLVHKYPFFPKRIFTGDRIESLPFEENMFDIVEDSEVGSIDRFANGDLLVTFGTRERAFPYAGGIARIDKDGNPVWFRRDYSHHWPHIMEDGLILVPSLKIRKEHLNFRVGDVRYSLKCSKPYYEANISILRGDGTLVRQISVLDSLLASPHRAVLNETTAPCDPLHLNYVRDIGQELASFLPDVGAGDVIVSLRNISAFGFIDKYSGEFKKLVRGSFVQQHSVQHVSSGKIALFDNLGGDSYGGPSRLLTIDFANGKEETVFPRPSTNETHPRVFSQWAGNIDISPDRSRALVSFTHAGLSYEIRIEDGAVLNTFGNLHDVRGVPVFEGEGGDKAALFKSYGIYYVE